MCLKLTQDPVSMTVVKVQHDGGGERGLRNYESLTQQPGSTGLHDAIFGRLEDGLWQRDGMPHHGAIQSILSHHCAAAPTFLPLPPLGSAVLKPYLGQKR